MAAEPGAVDLGDASIAADAQRFHAGCDCLTQLVRQHERGLILDSRSRAKASMLLPFTSLQNPATASRYVLSGSLCQANSVPEVIEKSRLHALQRQRGWSAERRHA